ncbi:hypothetical protein LIA77_06004 [Sarocladium implicatum]|nr:hypothetical protein LIA77_06004 [Sarocladium implicatum]
MPLAGEWRPLPSTPSGTVPPLLVSMEAGAADYTVRITDMANVWLERLDRRRICMRAWDQNTSIDPSDTPENMLKFLTSLRSALDPDRPGHDLTSLALLPGTGESATYGLILKINCEIPGLPTLRWTMQLDKAPTSEIATSVVLPLIQAQLAMSKEMNALEDLVRRKDSVMAKLLDKLEATGTGLENIFNSLSTSITGRKKVSRAVAEEKIRGLAPHDPAKWHESLESAADRPSDVTSLLAHAFSNNSRRCQTLLDIDETPGLDEWFHTFQSTKQLPLHGPSKRDSETGSIPQPIKQDQPDDDDDFQVQPTPPGLTSRAADDANDSTASEGESPPSRAGTKQAAGSHPRNAKPIGRLGTIGGRRRLSKQPTPSPEPGSLQQTSDHTLDDAETASEADGDPPASLPPSSPPPVSKRTPQKVGLGRIGGPKPKAVQAKPVARSTSPGERPKSMSTPKKLGVIGKRAADQAPEDGDHSARGRSREQGEPAGQAPRETSQERADRKRDELKRELEKKAAAGPAKKKRKF